MLGINNYNDFKKRIWIFFIDVLIMIGIIIVLIVGLALFEVVTENDSSISETKPKPELETETLSAESAELLCREIYEYSAEYDVDICLSCTEVSDFDKLWSVTMDGKMQDADGAWVKNRGHCYIHKTSWKIAAFSLAIGGQLIEIYPAFLERKERALNGLDDDSILATDLDDDIILAFDDDSILTTEVKRTRASRIQWLEELRLEGDLRIKKLLMKPAPND